MTDDLRPFLELDKDPKMSNIDLSIIKRVNWEDLFKKIELSLPEYTDLKN